MFATLNRSGEWSGEIWNRRKSGRNLPGNGDHSASFSTTRGGVASTWRCFPIFSAIKDSEHELMHLAHHDRLTGLPNRLLFTDRVTQARHRRKSTSVDVPC